ncbi:MAG: hypothetical protein COW52_14260, partial [Nitrospirae bacterium CG17_big_fil_post_rev_8_21_14_2_50_50_9]
FFSGPVWAGKIVQGSGTGVILKGDVEGARNRALDKALRNAIQESLSGILNYTEAPDQDKAYEKILSTDPFYYIEWYRFVLDARVENLYKIELEASVSEDKVKKRLSDIGVIPHASESLRLGILITNRINVSLPIGMFSEAGEDFTGFAGQQFHVRGFQVMDGPLSVDNTPESFEKLRENNQLTAIQGRRLGVDAVVLGQVEIGKETDRPGTDRSENYHVEIWVRAIRSRDAAVLGLREGDFILEKNASRAMSRQQVYQHFDSLLALIGKDIYENAK